MASAVVHSRSSWATTGVQDPLGNYTSATYNANGLPTQIAYGDTNSDATDGGYQRTVFFYYDSTFPGRLAEVRRKSDLHASASSCSISSTTGCVRTLYSYDATSKQLASVSLQGTTLDTDGDPTSFTSTTTYSLDSKARVTQIDGAVSPMKTTFAYRNVSDPYEDGFLEYTRMYWGPESTDYLASTVLGYDFWGNPTGVMTPDGTVTCTTYDSARGYLSSRREAMDGQTTCVTSDDSDLVTTWTRDSALRITQLERPDESCMFWEYDTSGRLARTKRRDNCNAGSSGDKEEYLYTAEGLLYEIDTYDAGSTITRKQIMNYHASRRLAGITNPVDVTKSRTFVYDAAGMVTQVDHENSLGKTTYTLSADRRVTSESRYKDASNADTWQFLYDWLGNPSKVTDEDSKETETVRDDAGRIVKLVSPDMSYPTLRVYDAADRLTTMKQAFGGGDHEKTHTFTYDALSRPLEDNYAGACTGGTPHAEIIRSYDSTSGCPGTCSALEGRLAKVTVALLCDGNGTDGSLDQSTWYGYDDAGRNVGEYIEDDASRSASQTFAWSKNGALEQVNTPSGVEVIWGYGSAGNNSDKDRVTSMTRISTPVVEDVAWYPYGPLKSYAWEAETGGPASLSTAITRNLAYRPTFVGNGIYSGSNVLVGVTLDEDAKGRITQRVYSSDASGTSGVTDSFFLYDHQDRVTCETTTYQSSCPTSGSGLKNNLASFTDAGDWETLYRPIPGSTGFTHTFNPSGYGSSHQVTLVRQNSGSPSLGDTELGYDARGNRTYDDNTTTLTNDRRDYTYDARGNVVNVHGKFWSTTTIPNQWVEYDVASAFDARNRRVYKSFTDGTTTATWFFYYDPYDRLVEVRYTPTTSSPNTYQLFQLFWLGDRLAFYWQTDQNGGLTSRRYVATDELRRPISLWTWPDTGGTERAWAINPSAWGFDTNVAGATVFQPFLFRGQYFDSESVALTNDGTTVYRPPLAIDSSRVYDPFIGAYLQVASRTSASLFGYLYAGSNPAASAVESPDKGTDTLSDIGSLVGQHSLLPREQMAIPDGLNHTYQVFVVSFLMTGDTVCPYPDEKLRPYAERWGAQPAGEIIDLSSVLTGCQTTFHYEPLAVVCDLGCVPIRDNARCWVEAPGTQWDQHPVPLSELNIDVPGVHLGNGSHIRDCSCMCGVLVQPCCDTPHGGEDSGDEGGGHPQ